MPLDFPHLVDRCVVPHGAGVRCKRKMDTVDMELEDCPRLYKKEKLEEPSVEHQWWTLKSRPQEHNTQAHPDPGILLWNEGSMEVGMEVVHNSSAPWNVLMARPCTPTTQIMNTVDPRNSLSPMMGVEDAPNGMACDGRSSSHCDLESRKEFCSVGCRGAPRSPVSNRIRCSCQGPYDRPCEQHYISDYY